MKKRILDQKGQGLTEYIMLLLVVSISSLAIAQTLGKTIHKKVKEANDHINKDVTIYGND